MCVLYTQYTYYMTMLPIMSKHAYGHKTLRNIVAKTIKYPTISLRNAAFFSHPSRCGELEVREELIRWKDYRVFVIILYGDNRYYFIINFIFLHPYNVIVF